MMGHIYQRDWCATRSPRLPFVDEVDIDNSVVERILRNKFWDPLISSEEDEPVGTIDWNTVFKKKSTQEHQFNNHVPGCRKPPPHPRLSALTKTEHYQMVKVLTSYNDVLPRTFLGKVTKADFRVFEEKKDIYAEEQKEYIEWAKNLWVTTNCIRALRPKPSIETVYEAELKMQAHMLQCFPKKYTLAAQIPLKSEKYKCEIVLPKTQLIEVNISNLPEVFYPPLTQKKFSILQDIAVPEPCTQHPCKFKLPYETAESLLPLTEIHKELAQYALENGAQYVASEAALACLLETDRTWSVPVSVCQVIDADGEPSNIVVLGNEFPIKKDVAPTRCYKAFKHMLQKAFTAKSSRKSFGVSSTSSYRTNVQTNNKNGKEISTGQSKGRTRGAYTAALRKIIDVMEDSDDSDDDRLLIDFRGDSPKPDEREPQEPLDNTNDTDNESDNKRTASELGTSPPRKIQKVQPPAECNDMQIELYDCVCKDTEFESPTPRSYRNVQIKNTTTKELINVIIHCPHKLRNERGNEVILEPIVEYQLDVGGTLPSRHKLQALAFSLMLRKNADLLNVRVDGTGGEVVTIDTMTYRDLTTAHGDFRHETANSVYTALNQLGSLLPGQYLLRHEPSHGCNAILYSHRLAAGELVTLDFGDQSAAEEAKLVQAAPALGAVLLPHHKYRRTLPLAFTYDMRFVSKQPNKPTTRVKPPPPAMLWPKKGKKKRGKKKNNN